MIITLHAHNIVIVYRLADTLLLLYELCYKKADEDNDYAHEEIGYEFQLLDLLLKDNGSKYYANAGYHRDLAADDLNPPRVLIKLRLYLIKRFTFSGNN